MDREDDTQPHPMRPEPGLDARRLPPPPPPPAEVPSPPVAGAAGGSYPSPAASSPGPYGAEPPTAPWDRPPVGDATRRPVAPIAGGTGSVPPAPPTPTPAAVPPPRPDRRGWKVLLGGLTAAVLLLGGVAVGAWFVADGDDGGDTTSSALRPVVADESPAEVEDVPGPLAGEDSEEPIADVAGAVAPSVVLIQTGVGQGSGIVWDGDDGHIVTNAHVVGSADTVDVWLPDGRQVNGSVVGTDPSRDIAVVSVDPAGLDLTEAVFAPIETVEVGQVAVAIGSPFGLDQTVTAGIVSAVNRVTDGGISVETSIPVEMIQTDAPINPGNSGGALADRQGRVVGMNTSIRTSGTSDGNVGVGFAIPSDTIVLIAERILTGESLETGFLGIEGITPVDGRIGARVSLVTPGDPADVAGLEVGDLIVRVGPETIESMPELSAEIKLYRPDETVEIEIIRDDERFVVEATLGVRGG